MVSAEWERVSLRFRTFVGTLDHGSALQMTSANPAPSNRTCPRDAATVDSAHTERMRRDNIRLDLKREESGIKEFAIDGLAMGNMVSARWDGEFLVMSRCLYELLCLARAVEDVFIELGIEERWRACRDAPSQVAIEILGGLDHVTRIDYEPDEHSHPG